MKWTRRGFIAAGGLIGGGLVLGIALAPNRLTIKGPHSLNTWVKLTPDNKVTVIVPHCDIGQGAQTALAMMLAEEMDADWAHVTAEEAPALPAYGNEYIVRALVLGITPPSFLLRPLDAAALGLDDLIGLQVTGGSASVRATGEMGMRTAGAAARAMLIQAAATRWSVAPETCTAAASLVTHTQTGRSFTFGALATDAALYTPPLDPPLKPYTAWKLVGTSPPRFDIPSKVDGTAKYGIDTILPNMLVAAITASPVHGGKLVSADTATAEKMPGVTQIVRLDDAVAVIADGYWHAKQALAAIKPVFDNKGHDTVSSPTILADQRALLAGGTGSTDVNKGDATAALATAAHVVTAEYSVPYQAHAPMEPPNATVLIANGTCEIWTGVQDPLNARATAAKAAGLSRDNVTVHNCKVGGGFGRRTPFILDFITQAVQVAAAASPRPVKLIWSREEDLARDYFRPTVVAGFKAGLDAKGTPIAYTTHYTGDAGENAAHIPYDIDNVHISGSKFSTHVRTGPWRSVDHSQHGFFTECFIDELAQAAGKDPFEFRRNMLPAGSRHRAVLELAAAKSNWGTPLPPRSGRGIALIEAFGSIVAQVAEITILPAGDVRVRRVTAVVDCGDVVHPDTAISQIEGGIMYALAAALYGEITIENGAVVQRNFDTFQVARMVDAPAIDVHFIASHAKRGGIGEVGVPAMAPALCNAIAAASGVRVRALPVRTVAGVHA